MTLHLEGSQALSPSYDRNSGCDTQSSSKKPLCRRLLLELSGPAVTLTDNFSSFYLSAWSSNWQHAGCCATNVPALGQWGAPKAPPIHPPKASQSWTAETKTQRVRETSAFTFTQTLFLPDPTFFFLFYSPHFTHSRLTLASQMHQPQWAADDTDCCGDMQDYSSTRGWKGSFCSVPSVRSYSVLLQSKSILQNYIVSITTIVLLSADLSGSDP